MRHEIADRISADLVESDSPLTSATIAATYLKLANSSGPAVDALVRAMLGRDGRFCEVNTGQWALAAMASSLSPTVIIAVFDIPSAAGKEPWLWRLQARLADDHHSFLAVSGPEWSDSLALLFDWLSRYPIATDRPGYLSRWLGARERMHALSETDPLIIDLAAWRKRLENPAAVQPGRSIHDCTTPRRSDTTSETDRLGLAGNLLAEIIDSAESDQLGSWEQVVGAMDQAATDEQLLQWRDEWDFTPEVIQSLPEQPGIYRFLASDGSYLYIGKSRNLRQRVASYFRPLTNNSSRRAEFLNSIRRFEYEPASTELEALILEAEEIRIKKPAWNVMINLGGEETVYSLGEEEVICLVPYADGSGRTLFALSGARAARGAVNHDGDAEALIAGLRRFYVEGCDGEGLTEIGSPERALVRRWLRTTKENCAVFHPLNFPTYEELVGAVFTSLAVSATAGEEVAALAATEIIRG